MTKNSEVVLHASGGTTFAGPDAMKLFKAITLRSAIRMHQRSGMIPTRGVTITKMFALAGEFTAKRYKRGEHEQALADLDVWIATMKAAMPITDERGGA